MDLQGKGRIPFFPYNFNLPTGNIKPFRSFSFTLREIHGFYSQYCFPFFSTFAFFPFLMFDNGFLLFSGGSSHIICLYECIGGSGKWVYFNFLQVKLQQSCEIRSMYTWKVQFVVLNYFSCTIYIIRLVFLNEFEPEVWELHWVKIVNGTVSHVLMLSVTLKKYFILWHTQEVGVREVEILTVTVVLFVASGVKSPRWSGSPVIDEEKFPAETSLLFQLPKFFSVSLVFIS